MARTQHNMKVRSKAGVPKSHGYLTRIFTVEYDLKGMIDAYGIDFIHWFADEIAAGRVDCRHIVDRWAATVAISKDYSFNSAVFTHNDDELDLGDAA